MIISLIDIIVPSVVVSIQATIIDNDNSEEIRCFCLKDFIYIPYHFITKHYYHIIVSIVCNGFQITKFQYSFLYHKNDQYKINKIHLSFSSSIAPLSLKKSHYQINDCFVIHPLIMYREENNHTSVYVNGNVLLLKGKLRKVFHFIQKKLTIDELGMGEEEIVERIHLLILKGCVICYEAPEN